MESILPFIAFLAVVNLLVLSWIDLKTWLLPNKLNLSFAILGIIFHSFDHFTMLDPMGMALGGLVGAGILYIIRAGGNWYYKQDTLGLGDVKLLGAAGLWLGPTDVIMALTVGAFAGLVHGIIVAITKAIREKAKPDMHRLMIPAGPGFCIGILLVGIWKFLTILGL